jgi:hypothetical protein
MATRKSKSESSLQPSLTPKRAIELVQAQKDVGQTLLAKSPLERLEYDEWEQTTRAVVAKAFGESSENLARYESASPAYAARMGEDDRFWAQYRHDELEAKVASLASCLAQLKMDLPETDEDKASSHSPAQSYASARKVLKRLYEIFVEYGNLNWSVEPDHDEADWEQTGLDAASAHRALEILNVKRFAKHVGQSSFVITESGIQACEHPEVLDRELPIQAIEKSAPSAMAKADVDALDQIVGLIQSTEFQPIVARDLLELKIAIREGLAKCTLLLGGSILETLLIDILDRNRAIAASFLKKRRFPEEASLPDLISIASDPALLDSPRHLLTPTSVALAKALTDHRDLIHPHAEARGTIRVDQTTAQSIVHLLALVVRDLAEAQTRGDISAYENK